jgi:HrpA-like RNA helicase
MSATMNADIFQTYLSQAPHITAEGRTFPVDRHYLEDIHEQLDYVLSRDSPAALRSHAKGSQKRRETLRGAGGGKTKDGKLLSEGWGDDEDLDESGANPYYSEELYADYGQQVHKNIRRLDESATDYDLIDDLVCYICEGKGPGAILVFLSGIAEITRVHDRLQNGNLVGVFRELNRLQDIGSAGLDDSRSAV